MRKSTYRILTGDAIEQLRTLPDRSVQCVVTSPPYYALRDYGVPGQIGLEDTPQEYVARLVEVFREVRRVLRDDGTVFLNLGDSYSNRTPNIADCMNDLLKGALVFFFDTVAVTASSEGVNVPAHSEGPHESILLRLLCSERVSIEDRQDDLYHVADFLTGPGDRGASCAVSVMVGDMPAAQGFMQIVNGGSIVIANGDTDSQTKLAVLRASCTGPRKDDDATLAVEEADEPGTEGLVRWHSVWDSFALAARSKGVPNIDLMNQPVSFRDGHLSFAGLCRDFRITQASEQQVTFESVGGGLRFTVADVRHLRFSFADGSVIPYRTLYDKSTRIANRNRAKQELGIPDRVKVALQEDGWICRSTIIWHKPNPMPESTQDRPTKSHEYIFLLTKSARYYYDSVAVAEPAAYPNDKRRPLGSQGAWQLDGRKRGENGGGKAYDHDTSTRNRRSVWTIATAPYSGAHFATFPPKLVEPCILAGTSERGCCPACGAPWRRVVERKRVATRPGTDTKVTGDTLTDGNRDPQRHVSESTTIGWQPTCDCDAGEPVPCVVLDPFGGSGTTAAVAMELGQDAILCELNPEYIPLARDRIEATIQWIKDGKPGKKPKKAKVIESDFVQPGMLDLEI